MHKKISNESTLSTKSMLGLIFIAYAFSFLIRMIWVWQFQDNPNFIWDGQLMINTNDGYYFASTAEYFLNGLHADNPRTQVASNPYYAYIGLPYLTYLLSAYTPFSLNTIILYLPTIISSLIVIPIILTGKLLKLPFVGFFAALLGSIAWSYYNRTMTGYYDTDMFSVFLQFTMFYLFLFTVYKKADTNILWLSLVLLVYPYFYPQGLMITYAMFLFWAAYQLLFQKDEKNSYLFIILASISLWSVTIFLKLILIIGLFLFHKQLKNLFDKQKFFYMTLISIVVFLYMSNVFEVIWIKISLYLDRSVEEHGLHFYQVVQTIREAGQISWETVANRIIGHPLLLLLSLAGYILLVWKHRPFIIALPLIGIGVFAHWAGLRFTVYAVPVAAFSIIYLFYFMAQYIKNTNMKYVVFVGASLLALYPNIAHIIDYKVPTVLNKTEVQDLVKLNTIADPKDYTISWWDYGYPIWYYSDTSTLIDGGKHSNDNFIISKIMQTDSAELAVNLSRLAVETYAEGVISHNTYVKNGEKEEDIPAKFKMINKDNEIYHAGRKAVINLLTHNGQKDQIDPNLLMEELKSDTYKLPKKTRDIYLYLPYRMMRIFPTVSLFGNLDLTTGKPQRKLAFYPTSVLSNTNGIITFRNGIVFDAKKGEVSIGSQKKMVKHFIISANRQDGTQTLQSQLYHADGEYAVIFMQSYGQFIVMDSETFNSTYVQMFMLGKYDKNLFELVVSSPYSKIYKLKK